jgi:hypothetical protein
MVAKKVYQIALFPGLIRMISMTGARPDLLGQRGIFRFACPGQIQTFPSISVTRFPEEVNGASVS